MAGSAAGKREYMEDRSCIINDFRPLGSADDPVSAVTTISGVFDGHLSAKAAQMAANNLHVHLAKGTVFFIIDHDIQISVF